MRSSGALQVLSLPAGVFGSFLVLQALGLANDIYAQVAWYEREGLVDKNVDAKDCLDLSFVQGHLGVPH